MTEQSDKPSVDGLMNLVGEFGQMRWSEGSTGATYLDRAGERRAREEAADTYVEIRAYAERLAALAGPLEQPQLWQWRRKGEPWTLEKTFTFEVFATTDDSEVRPLFATATAEQPQEPTSDKANLTSASGGEASKTARPASHDVTTCPYFSMYLDLSEASGYPHEKDTMVSPEEYGAALLKDAERYRWLRDGCADTCIGVYNRPWSNDRHWLCANELDAAIDSAIAACEASAGAVPSDKPAAPESSLSVPKERSAMVPDYSELLQRIREAAGDPTGKLMQDELVERIAKLCAPSGQDFYLGGPYHDGTYSICEIATGRVRHSFNPTTDDHHVEGDKYNSRFVNTRNGERQ